MPSPLFSLDPLYQALRDTRTANYVSIASIALIVYDHCLTFSREVQFIWRARWTFVKIVYIFLRYYGVGILSLIFAVQSHINPPIKFCQVYFYVSNIGGIVILAYAVDIVFMLRIWALYNQSRKVLAFLVMVVIASWVLQFYGAYVSIHSTKFSAPPLGLPWPGCVPLVTYSHRNLLSLIAWIPCTITTSIFFTMTLVKFVKLIRSNRLTMSIPSGMSPILTTFVQDGTIFFLITFSFMLVCTVVVNTKSLVMLSYSFINCLLGIYCYCGSRLILNLRVAAESSAKTETSTPGPVMLHGLEFQYHSGSSNTESTDIEMSPTWTSSHVEY